MLATALVRENTTVDSANARWSPDLELTPQSFLPLQVSLFGRIAPEWRIVEPLTVTIDRENGFYIASDDVFVMYGLGEDIPLAIKDYISVLTEYYEVLAHQEDAPSVALFHHLQGYLRHQ